ncbi:replication-relaxation family protein [Micromonospora aurantiaca]|uniref:replication-relaxation family protein n=1 Tax=Micromonospora aurantiaca (nom. illeg.) TaxID=47850 RepID=UPI003659A17A
MLDRPLTEMGAAARGAAHAMAVNTTLQALLQPQPDDAQAAGLREGDQAVLEAGPPGLGRLEGLRTEVPLPITGSGLAPVPGSPQADLVLRAPEHDLPVAFVEVDRGTITPARLAQKAISYQTYFTRAGKHSAPWWRQHWHAPAGDPVLLYVFTAHGETAALDRARQTMALLHERDLPFPVLGTLLPRLQQRGPWSDAWWHAARGGNPCPLDLGPQLRARAPLTADG